MIHFCLDFALTKPCIIYSKSSGSSIPLSIFNLGNEDNLSSRIVELNISLMHFNTENDLSDFQLAIGIVKSLSLIHIYAVMKPKQSAGVVIQT